MTTTPHAIVLFSGGLDSILAAKVLEEQGLVVRCLHCFAPFFGAREAVPCWRKLYNLDITALDVGISYCHMLALRPEHGFGKVMNPCVDCKILLLRHARRYMESVGARFLATGEVLGQRPMSQRRDTLNIIPREAGVSDILLRPLCAQHLQPIAVEREGLVDRSRLLDFSGRGRTSQLALARKFGLKEIPTPGGGCKLTERENARRYWPVLRLRGQGCVPAYTAEPHSAEAAAQAESLPSQAPCLSLTRDLPLDAATPEAVALTQDFELANLGRQFWLEQDGARYWLSIGRNNADNKKLDAAARPHDALISLCALPGPLALAREGADWPRAVLSAAAALTASYAPKAVAQAGPVTMRAAWADGGMDLHILPQRENSLWAEPAWPEVKAEIRNEARARLGLPPVQAAEAQEG